MIRKIYNYFFHDSLYKNSIYLIISNLVMAGLGFLFWTINTKLFTPEQVGLATTLISTMALISSFSLLGLDVGLVRYLPLSKQKNDKINSSLIIIVLTSIAVATIFLLSLESFSPKLAFLKDSPLIALSFIFFVVFSGLNVVVQNVFIAFRSARYVLIKSSLFSTLKLMIPFFLVGFGGYGLFSSWGIALAIASITSLIILKVKLKYKFHLNFNKRAILKMSSYSLGNYVAGFLDELPVLILPLIITNLLRPETTAYYYMAMTIAALLYIIPEASTQSLFAEGSHTTQNLQTQLKKTLKIISLFLIPAILITIFLGKYVLLFFGKAYSAEGLSLLQILAISGIFVAVNFMLSTILRIKHKIRELILINLTGAIIILSLSYLFITNSLVGIGMAWLIGQGVMCLIYSVYSATIFLYKAQC